jgi:hypothetical protein
MMENHKLRNIEWGLHCDTSIDFPVWSDDTHVFISIWHSPLGKYIAAMHIQYWLQTSKLWYSFIFAIS